MGTKRNRRKKRMQRHHKEMAYQTRRAERRAQYIAARLLGRIKPGEALFFLPGSPEWKELNWKKLL